VTAILDATEAALLDLPDLSGHDQMELAAAFAHARGSAPVKRERRVTAPRNPYEHALLARAAALQSVIEPTLGQLDRKLASYQRTLRCPGLQLALTRLDLQAELGARLVVSEGTEGLSLSLNGPSRRGGLAGLVRSTHGLLIGFQDMAEAIWCADNRGQNWLNAGGLQDLHARTLPDCRHAGKLRKGRMAICSPFNGSVSYLAQPAEGLRPALAELVDGFDADLWAGIHPLVRAALLHLELVRLHPFSDGNGRLARLLMLGVLHEAGIDGLPLNTVFEWNRHSYLAAIDHAVTQGNDLGWLHFCQKVVGRAMALGRSFGSVLQTELAVLNQSLRHMSDSATTAGKLTAMAGSMVLGPDPQIERRGFVPVDCAWRFERCRQLDTIPARGLDLGLTIDGAPCPSLWSHPIARLLLQKPPARL
jgi:fido (protein-threonine AMPylation protein)